jgi:hypothetical protein
VSLRTATPGTVRAGRFKTADGTSLSSPGALANDRNHDNPDAEDGPVSTSPQPQAAPAQKGALSVSQMLQLMRREMDSALTHRYPISCLLISLDGFEGDSVAELRPQAVGLAYDQLKDLTIKHSIRGMALKKEHVILAVLPHTDPEATVDLGERLVRKVRQLTPAGSRQMLTVSVGVGHNQHEEASSFDSMLAEADTGLNIARSGGGNRCVQWKNVERELDKLREELDEQIKEIEARAPSEDDGESDRQIRDLVEKVMMVFSSEADQSEVVVRLGRDVIALVADELVGWTSGASGQELADSMKQVDLLERRVRKLTEHLSGTEAELKRVAAMKVVDGGIASLYSGVQGLDGESEDFESKKAMLTNIFEANLALRDDVSEES